MDDDLTGPWREESQANEWQPSSARGPMCWGCFNTQYAQLRCGTCLRNWKVHTERDRSWCVCVVWASLAPSSPLRRVLYTPTTTQPKKKPPCWVKVMEDNLAGPWMEASTTREKASSSAGFRCISSAGTRATNTALQLTHSSSACAPALLLHKCSSSAVRVSSLPLVVLALFGWTRYCYWGVAANFYTLATANLSSFFGIFVLYWNRLCRRIFST